MQEETYRGYLIEYHFTDKWFANIKPPNRTLLLSGGPVLALKEEGSVTVLKRAKLRIDQEEAKSNRSK